MSQDNDRSNGTLTNRPQDNQTQSQREQLKLPRLAAPQSRGRIGSRKQNKMPLHLPSLNVELQQNQNFRNTDTIHVSRSQHDMLASENQSSRDEVCLQVGDRLKIMMGQQDNNNELQNEDGIEQDEDISDDLDFEQKIMQNKEIIKMHRKKNQPSADKRQSFQGLERVNQSNKPKFGKPQSNYERKMKDYNLSLQNKYLQRKKQSLGIIPQKSQKQPMQRAKSKKVITSMQDASIHSEAKSNEVKNNEVKTNQGKSNEAKTNFGYKQFKNSAISKSQANKDASRPLAPLNNINKITNQQSNDSSRQQKQSIKQNHKTQQPLSPSKKINRTSALFDNIQSFLQNPIASEKHDKFYRELFRKLKSSSIPKLEEKIKQLNEKMGNNENYDTKQTIGKEESTQPFLLTQSPLERTARDWKRVDVKDKHKLKCKESDFQKELQYISYLQEKSSVSLSKFIDHQKHMIELQINKRFSKSIAKEHPSETKIIASQRSGEERV